MKLNKCIFLFVISLCSLLTACTTSTDPADLYKDESAQQIFQHGEEALRGGNFQEATKRLEALDIQYPLGRDTETAQLHLIYAYYMAGDYASAEAAADRFIHSHPIHPHVDYAYFMQGLSNYYQNLGVFERFFAVDLATRDLTQIKKSYMNFAELTRLFPTSHYTPAAHQYLVYLRNMLAEYEMEVADYYYSRAAYIAAANRATLVVRHYEGAPAVPNALVLMAKSYRALQLKANEEEVLAVLQYNYPNSTYVQEATG